MHMYAYSYIHFQSIPQGFPTSTPHPIHITKPLFCSLNLREARSLRWEHGWSVQEEAWAAATTCLPLHCLPNDTGIGTAQVLLGHQSFPLPAPLQTLLEPSHLVRSKHRFPRVSDSTSISQVLSGNAVKLSSLCLGIHTL